MNDAPSSSAGGDVELFGWPARIRRHIGSFSSLLFTVFLALCFRSFVFEPFNVPSGSMKSALLEGDYIVVSKYSYGYSRYSFPFHLPLVKGRLFKKSPKRGDIVVFVPESLGGIYYVKRVIGLPGDKIQIENGVLHINGAPVERRFVDMYANVDRDGTSRLKRYVEVLDNGVSYHVLQEPGFHFSYSTQEYVVPEGKYFMMGDNRDHSRDSRFLDDIGYVSEESLVGKAFVVAFSLSPDKNWYSSVRFDRIFSKLGKGPQLLRS